MVEANLVQAAKFKKQGYDRSTQTRRFAVNNPVWLLILHQGKLDSKWQGGSMVKEIKSPVNVNIVNNKATARLCILTVYSIVYNLHSHQIHLPILLMLY